MGKGENISIQSFFNRHRISVLQNEMYLEMDSGNDCIEKAGNGKTGRLDRRKGERQTRKGGPV